jgi:outer membrane protein OmpA-like peptidoglycan-associated protein
MGMARLLRGRRRASIKRIPLTNRKVKNQSIMNSSFTFEAEPFAGYSATPNNLEADEFERDPFESEASENEAIATPSQPRSSQSSSPQNKCLGYEKGEIQKSWTAHGHLPTDVSAHGDGILIADFPVNARTPRESLTKEKALRDWLATLVQVIRSNPSTRIEIRGFSDCVGKERNNRLLRQARAIRVRAIMNQMVGNGPQWNSLKSKIKLTDRAPDGQYVSSNATIEGRAQNRSVLIESTQTIAFDPIVSTACIVLPARVAVYPLLGLIPNVPDYTGKLPINYNLDAKKLVGEVAQDISSLGHKAHFITEISHAGFTAVEIFELVGATGTLAGVLTVLAPLTALLANFIALGAGYAQAAEILARDWSASGYSRGVVMGADGRKPVLVKEYFRNACCPKDNAFPAGRGIAIANYRTGLMVGYTHGRMLCPNQRAIFWKDLVNRMDNQSYRGPSAKWTARGWSDWYTDAAGAFRKAHLL